MVTYEELIQLEYDFDDVDCEITRQQYKLSTNLYTKRNTLTSAIPHFWALVLEQAPTDIDQFITPSDSKLIAECLTGIEVTRPEIIDPAGSPRTVHIKFTFSENEWFEDKVLEKTFYFRRASDTWSGLVSEPVKINWKKGKDLTKGLTDAAYNLWQKKEKLHLNGINGVNGTNGAAKKLPEETTLERKLEIAGEESTSFFTFFSFRKKKGEEVEDVKMDESAFEEQDLEVCPHGGEVAMVIADDIWPNAIKYFTTAQEDDDDDDDEFEGFEDMEDSDEDERVDIRSLVQGKRKDKASSVSPVGIEAPPLKTRKT
ncbi:hypothetical protein NA57DRAFT_43401 [Rhizodiscina lignyota]|uniref:Nucleosome assembly protein n=1 Tax=Rhizodiscina lignyota TaxID=1504668 RepID=A0A9P4I9B6_9PEZI|nr:hypothetical protein NA57DRAFT_43401 [Rhizodiscina lignyota]